MTPFTHPSLIALVDCLIPADDFPSGSQADVVHFLQGLFEHELSGRLADLERGLRQLDTETQAVYQRSFSDLEAAAQHDLIAALLSGTAATDWGELTASDFLDWLIRLSVQGFYGDPGNGGNRDGVAWKMLEYHPLPEGARWPDAQPRTPQTITWDDAKPHYDAVVVGAGAGGGVAACVLAEAGQRVLLVERGAWLDTNDLRHDHLRSQRLSLGYRLLAGPPSQDNPRTFAGAREKEVVFPSDPRYSNNAVTVGGGTRVYGAQAWRFSPEDFRMASLYGVPEDSSLSDWPISYGDLEADYDRAEWELGVSGDAAGNVCAGERKRGYPMPPLPPNGTARVLKLGAHKLGLHTSPVPLLINSLPYNGRGACLQCGACVGFGCPGEFKTDTRNSVIPRAIATGRCDVLTGVQAERVLTDPAGQVTGVALVTRQGGELLRREVTANQVLLGAGAIETARLLLSSASPQEPGGLGNAHDQVGRHLQGHVYAGAFGVFDEQVQDSLGPGPSIATNDYRHGNAGIIGGAMLANDFVPMPLWVYHLLTGLTPGLPAWGLESKQAMRETYPKLALVFGPVQEIPTSHSRVTLDPAVRDAFGIPVACISGAVHPATLQTAQFIAERAADWLRASGASRIIPLMLAPAEGPSGGQHQAGTCRMGRDPASSVTNAWGQVWGHANLHIVDGSLHVTNGGVNPVLTILALAYRVSQQVANLLDAEKRRATQAATFDTTPSFLLPTRTP